jgi:altronate dehydratase large subunit
MFLGYERPDGSVGIRNHVLIIPTGFVSDVICNYVAGTKTIITADTGGGRTKTDRETIARTLVGLGRNPNVASVIVQGISMGAGYAELGPDVLAEQIAESGKRVEVLKPEGANTLDLVAKGIDLAREMVHEASKLRRKSFDDSYLTLGVKCGTSDTLSGIAGNPVIGYVFDKLVEKGGTCLFGENTEIIGAEHVLAKRAVNESVAEEILRVAEETEARAKSTGEDIRTINPVPENIAAGISSLEEKSLGAIQKAGSQPIQGVLKYSERPKGKGLYFMDNWALNLSIYLGYQAAGSQLIIYQLGGGGLMGDGLLYVASGEVAPLLWTSANAKTRDLAGWKLDFYSGRVIDGKETIEEAGERLYSLILDVASGTMTTRETLNWTHPKQIYLTEPYF